MVENKELEELRRKIDMLDDRLSEVLKRRLELTKEIKICKKKNKISIRDLDREEKIVGRMIKNGVPERFVRKIYSTIFEESLRIQGGI